MGSPFKEYFDSIYGRSNLLSPQEYEDSARGYDLNYSSFLPTRDDARILDIGCGAGHFLYYLKKRGFINYHGIDLSPGQVEFCKTNITPNVEVAESTEFLSNKLEAYDVISANDVIEHIPKERVIKFLETIYRSLRPSGVLLLKLPNMSNPFALDSRYRDFTHESGFTEKSIYQVLYTAGFRDIQVYPCKVYGRSIRFYLSRVSIMLFHWFIRKLFWWQGFVAPEILTHLLIVIAKKGPVIEGGAK